MKKDTYYFSHDATANNDPKCVMLIEQLGLEGYGIFWVIIETLREQPDYKYPLTHLGALARRFNTSAEKMKTVVLNYGLFVIDEAQNFFSLSLNRRMDMRNAKSEQARKSIQQRWEKERTAKLLQLSTNNTDVLRLNNGSITGEVQLKEIKEKEIKENNTPIGFSCDKCFEDFWKIYPIKIGKKKVKDKYLPLIKKDYSLHETMVKAVMNQILEKETLRSKGEFCPHWKNPLTWINQGCWEDEPLIIQQTTPQQADKPVYKDDWRDNNTKEILERNERFKQQGIKGY